MNKNVQPWIGGEWVDADDGAISAATEAAWESHLPPGGGAGLRSGVGRVGGRFSMERLTELTTIVVDLG